MALEDQTPYGLHDICLTALMETNCDGTLKEGVDPLVYCGTSSVTFRETVEAEQVQESPNPPGTTGKTCLRRRIKPKRSDKFVDLLTCGLIDPRLMAMTGQAAPIIDENTGECLGWEEPLTAEEKCESCAGTSATCTHSVALLTLHNRWCGDDVRADPPYGAFLYPSLEFEPVDQSFTLGGGFTFFQTYTAKLKSNPNFVDPFGLDPRPATQRSTAYRFFDVSLEAGGLLESLIDDSCACGVCSDGLVGV